MRRLFYIALGAGVGVAAVRKATKAAQKLTPANLADSVTTSVRDSISGLGGSIKVFLDDVRVNMAVREAELHDALQGSPPPGKPGESPDKK
jgi:hypothetical protein